MYRASLGQGIVKRQTSGTGSIVSNDLHPGLSHVTGSGCAQRHDLHRLVQRKAVELFVLGVKLLEHLLKAFLIDLWMPVRDGQFRTLVSVAKIGGKIDCVAGSGYAFSIQPG